MPYTQDQATHLAHEQRAVVTELQNLLLQCVVQGQSVTDPRVREHLLHGAARRVGVLKRSVENVFAIFPPSVTRPLASDALSDVQISLHAFVINLYGVFDNWAWAFVLRHDLEAEIRDRQRIGLFSNATRKYLPPNLKSYLSSTATTGWYEKYLKTYRDALVHRVPLYIPPAVFTTEEAERDNKLEAEKVECIKSMKWQRLDQVWLEQAAIGSPCFFFLHAFSEDDPPRPILLHPQLLSDSRAVVEFGLMFLEHWHERA